MKLSPILNKKICGILPVKEFLGIICGITSANIFEAHVHIENGWRWLAWLGAWTAGWVLCAVVIAFVTKYITKE